MNESEYQEVFSDTEPVIETTCVFDEGVQCPYHKEEMVEWKASRAKCLSKISDEKLGTSTRASCVAQGLRPHSGKKKARVGNKIISLAGKRIKSSKYGGPLPTWNEE